MSADDCKNMELVAEVTVQRFFTHYLQEIFPKQLTATITAHNKDVTAHSQQIKDAVRSETTRVKFWLLGVIFAGGLGSGVGVAKALASLVGS